MLLSILIATTSDREIYYGNVMAEIARQIRVMSEWHDENHWHYVEILKDTRPPVHKPGGVSIGAKRNALLEQATGEYLAFVDSDDMVDSHYIRTIKDALWTKPDCLSLRGIITEDGINPQVFEHSLKWKEWRDNGATYPELRYERYPNHLNCIRSDIAKQFKFPETNHGEDHAWSKALHESGLLKAEVYIDRVLYYYLYRSNK